MPTQDGYSSDGDVINGHSPAKHPQNGHHRNGSVSVPFVPVNWELLARATAHPLRVSILEILGIDGGRVMSPSDLSRELQIPLSNTNYHVTELAKAGLIVLVRERQVRGATEHFYRLPSTGSEAKSAAEKAERAWAMA